MKNKKIDSIATTAKEMKQETSQTICFAGSIYQVKVVSENTGREKLIITRDGWDKPLVLG